MQVNIQGIEHEVNKHVALRLRLESMALRVLLLATVLEARSFYFSNFANGSERKGLSAFTGKFPSSTAGLHLVLNTSFLRKKSRLVRCRMVECFHAKTIEAL